MPDVAQHLGGIVGLVWQALSWLEGMQQQQLAHTTLTQSAEWVDTIISMWSKLQAKGAGGFDEVMHSRLYTSPGCR